MKIKENINLCIMYGGPGEEHEVSKRSAENIISSIDVNKYNLKVIYLEKTQNKVGEKDLKLLRQKKYVVCPIFHGEFGEGGKLQEVLEKSKIKFIGSKSKSAKLAMDKIKTQNVLEKNGILVPKSKVLTGRSYLHFINTNNFVKNFIYPIILKPVNVGSSVDLYKVKDKKGLENSLQKMFTKYKQVLMQEFVEGREFTCGVLEVRKNKKVKQIVLPATEIILTKGDTFNYEAKYSVGGCLEVTPAEVDAKLMKRIQEAALKVHKLIGCKDISRTDIILDKQNRLVVLEINTMPGMTKTSFIPQQLEAKNISVPKFIDVMMKNNLK